MRATAENKLVVAGGGEVMNLGNSQLQVSTIGVGVWAWGDQYWGYGKDYGKQQAQEAYAELLPSGLTFLDTAEVYGLGVSEQLTGEFVKAAGQESQMQVATKFAPLPWRLSAGSVEDALRASLTRLGAQKVSLYMIHWPGIFNTTDAYVEGLMQIHQKGLADAVGVSNFNVQRIKSTSAALKARGIPLASNQVQYSLLYRAPETSGVMEACREAGVTLVAYSPLAQGLLTGKYVPGGEARPGGPRSAVFTEDKLRSVQPLLGLMREIGAARGGKTPGQIALNWTMCKGALPIPGVKNAKQAKEVAGALGWRLTLEEVSALDKASAPLAKTAFGAPFENW